MPTQTKFLITSGVALVDLSGVFQPLDGGTSYGSATNYKVGSSDLNTIFHASTSTEDRVSTNTGYKIAGGADLATVFRRYGFVGVIITTQPTTITRTTTQSASFSVIFNSPSAVAYQWKKNGVNLTGTGNSGTTGTGNNQTLTYNVNSVAMGDQGNYTITIGGVTSSNARLNISPRIIAYSTAPGSYTRYYGDYGSEQMNLQISSVDGESPLSYQWYKNGISLGTANGANTLQYNKTTASGDTGTYYCIITNAYGSATSGNYVITAVDGRPSISIQPTSQAVNNNTSAIFSITTTANVTRAHQWKKGGADISGATSTSYTTPALTTANDTDTYFCNVYTNYGSVNSNTVSTKIRPYVTGGTVTTGPYYFTAGANVANFTVTAAGSPTLSYAWQFSTNGSTFGSVLSTSSSYNLGTVTGPSQTGYYRVTVSSTLFGVTYSTTSTAYMQVSDVAPTITGGTVTGGPYSLAIGNVANFTVTATGTNLTYAWQFSTDNSSWGGVLSTASNYTFTTSSSSQTGYYRVTVSNGSGSVSDTAYMDVS